MVGIRRIQRRLGTQRAGAISPQAGLACHCYTYSVRKATKQDKKNGASMLQQVLILQGSGTELAACPINYGTAQKIEAWIRAHPSFRGNVPQDAPRTAPQGAASVNIADQLTKLVQLRDAGVLSPEEFDQAKAKLLG